jgi:hypothetical protein
METSKRRDCDAYRFKPYLFQDGMETSKRRDCDAYRFKPYLFQDGMETSKRRDCDSRAIKINLYFPVRWNGDLKKKGLRPLTPPRSSISRRMEWRPQKEGIATPNFILIINKILIDGMETSKRRDCDPLLMGCPLSENPDGMETSKRRDCDFQIRPMLKITPDGMETSKRRDCDPIPRWEGLPSDLRWNGDLKKKGLRPFQP